MNQAEKSLENLDKNNRKVALIAQTFLEYVRAKPGQKYLDVGCGDGGAARYIAQQLHLSVTGIDVDVEETIDLPNLTLQTADAQHLPFEDASFDFIFCCKAMHHIPNWRAAMREISRVLKPQGYLLISDLRFPYCWEFIKQRLRGKVGSFPRLRHIQTEATHHGLRETFLIKRIGDYDIMWRKLTA